MTNPGMKGISEEYLRFIHQQIKLSKPKGLYEKFCRFAEALRLSPPNRLKKGLNESIVFSGLNVTPEGVFSAALITLVIAGIFCFLFSLFVHDLTIISILFILPLATFYYTYSYPKFRAQVLKVQTGDEAIKIILYMVIYLKLHPSFEGAINFAATHVKGPISEDMRKAIWGLQSGRYSNIEEALSAYMPKWTVWNESFIRALNLLHGVLIEPSEKGREEICRKALSYLLTSTHRKMKSYVENIAGSINILHMMGLLLPVIGLIMFPMVSIFLHESINPLYIAIGYTVVLPIALFLLINRILLKRPSAFIVPDISKHPELPPPNSFTIKLFNRRVSIPILPLTILVGLMIMLYGIIHFSGLYAQLTILPEPSRKPLLLKEAEMNVPNLLASLSIVGGFGSMLWLYFYLKSFQRIKIRNDIKNVEEEFQIWLYSFGNYLAEGFPVERAVQKSLEEYKKLGMEKRPTFFFFSKLLENIKNLGMTFQGALFDKRVGIIKYFPSTLIEEIMRVLSDASRRGSVLLGSISKTIGSYLENLSKIEAKIRELLEDVRAGIKVQANFIVPIVCAITASLGVFLLNMLKNMSCMLARIERNIGLGFFAGTTEGIGSFLNTLVGDFTKVIPMTVLQAIVGVYAVEVVVLFAMLLNGIENGFDNVSRDYLIAKILGKALLVYFAVTLLTLFMFHGLILSVIQASGGMFVC